MWPKLIFYKREISVGRTLVCLVVILTTRISVGSRKLYSPTVLRLFSVSLWCELINPIMYLLHSKLCNIYLLNVTLLLYH
jgi:hypothetical protein